MITFNTDKYEGITMTLQEFREEANGMIQFALREKEYSIEEIDANMIAEDITGIFGKHNLCQDAMDIINEELLDVKTMLN